MKCFRHIHTVAPYKHTLVRRSSADGKITFLREDVSMCTRCRLHVRQAWRTPLRMLHALNFKRLFAEYVDALL